MSDENKPSDDAVNSTEQPLETSEQPADTGSSTTCANDDFEGTDFEEVPTEEHNPYPEDEEDGDDDGSVAGTQMAIRGNVLVDLLNPVPSVFKPEPIARTLSHINRFAGNYGNYSVAQHAYLVSIVVGKLGGSPFQELGALHHDDIEAITNDVPSPVKNAIKHFGGGFQELEARLSATLEERLGVSIDDNIIKIADATVLGNEILRLVPAEARYLYVPHPEIEALLPHVLLYPWGPDKAYAKYMDRHEELIRTTNKLLVAACKSQGITA